MQARSSNTEKYKLTLYLMSFSSKERARLLGNGIRKLIVVVLILFWVLSFLNFAKSQQATSQITSESIQTYAQTLINTYIQETNQYFPSHPANLTFNSNGSYDIKFYSSSQGGAALTIDLSTVQSFEIINSSERIETALFGNSDWSLFPMFEGIGQEAMFSNFQAQPDNHPFVEFANSNSSLILHNILLNSTATYRDYYVAIIKASNSTSVWTSAIASVEANRLLEDDTGLLLIPIIISDFNPISELTLMLENIKGNLTNSTYTSSDYLADLQKVQNLAKQYGVSSNTLNELIQFVNAQTTGLLPTIPPEPTPTPTPTPTPVPVKTIFNQAVNDPYNFLYVSFLGFGVVVDLIFAVCLDYYRKTKKPTIYKLLLGVPVGFLSLIFLPNLLLKRPYDLNIIQIVITVTIWIVGTLLVMNWRKELVFFLFRGKR